MKAYIAIDLKSFYASAECADRKLDPLTTNFVVADQSRLWRILDLCPLPLRYPSGPAIVATAPQNAKRRQDFSCRQAVPAITVPGSHRAYAARSSPMTFLPPFYLDFTWGRDFLSRNEKGVRASSCVRTPGGKKIWRNDNIWNGFK